MSVAPADRGFTYEVSDEQLRVFRAQSPEERLRWLEQTRETLWAMAPEATKQRWARARRGE